MNVNKWQLKCRVQNGMFDDEYLVRVNTLGKQGELVEEAAFVHKEELSLPTYPKGDNVVEGLVTVSLMGATYKNAFVVLPKSTLANGPVILVKRSDLQLSEQASAL